MWIYGGSLTAGSNQFLEYGPMRFMDLGKLLPMRIMDLGKLGPMRFMDLGKLRPMRFMDPSNFSTLYLITIAGHCRTNP